MEFAYLFTPLMRSIKRRALESSAMMLLAHLTKSLISQEVKFASVM